MRDILLRFVIAADLRFIRDVLRYYDPAAGTGNKPEFLTAGNAIGTSDVFFKISISAERATTVMYHPPEFSFPISACG